MAATVSPFLPASRIVPGAAPDASIVPVTVSAPPSTEISTSCAFTPSPIVRSPVLRSKLRRSKNPPTLRTPFSAPKSPSVFATRVKSPVVKPLSAVPLSVPPTATAPASASKLTAPALACVAETSMTLPASWVTLPALLSRITLPPKPWTAASWTIVVWPLRSIRLFAPSSISCVALITNWPLGSRTAVFTTTLSASRSISPPASVVVAVLTVPTGELSVIVPPVA